MLIFNASNMAHFAMPISHEMMYNGICVLEYSISSREASRLRRSGVRGCGWQTVLPFATHNPLPRELAQRAEADVRGELEGAEQTCCYM
ncbi:hypothetical protein Krac_7523 [Ktedonobacter racemifer DSM 44963]|uniref:Uncharacterized protein n=1 Tax=Ktedonobacter racemifer DSM 44963 TaxID=485913 RepID=D6TKD2_KTERA|nr:hypothetical protein Krac_7523 [Ktedonobacter racemifer DSM 44963]